MSAPTRILRAQVRGIAPVSARPLSPVASDRLQSQLLAQPGSPAVFTEADGPCSAGGLHRTSLHRTTNLPTVWFNSTFPLYNLPSKSGQQPEHAPDQERKVKLGKTLRILQERLPTLLQSPLPQEVLSPYISLHLFPSTHPHLPTVSGRVAYIAALWSSPIAWNRVPIVGNVKLHILSERMVDGQSGGLGPRPAGAVGEQLIVRWQTIDKGKNWGLPFINSGATHAPVLSGKNNEFTGLFIFDFDKDGRILSHTIEHVQSSGHWEQGVGAKVVGLTDWLLGGIRGGRDGSDEPCPAFKNES